jgi:N utilization substance protein B
MTGALSPLELKERRQMVAARHKARHFAVQALYQWGISGTSVAELEKQFREDFDLGASDLDYFRDLLGGVSRRVEEIDALLLPHLDIAPEKLGAVERAVLRMATYELLAREDVPGRVVLNEAVSLAKKFGAAESHRFVNGVLDKVARELRGPEMRSAGA